MSGVGVQGMRMQSSAFPLSGSKARSRGVGLVLCACLALCGRTGSAASGGEAEVMLNFTNADITGVAYAMAEVLQRNIVIDPKVKGTITLRSERSVSAEEAKRQFLAALRLSGYTMVADDGLYKIVTEADAKSQGARVIRPGSFVSGDGEVVTQIFRLRYESAKSILPVLRPLISPNNIINIGPADNSLIITDYAGNLARLREIIATLDVPSAANMEVIPLLHTVAEDIAPVLLKLLGGGGGVAGNASANIVGGIAILTDKRNNTLLLRAIDPAQIALARSFVAKLDLPSARDAGDMHVVYLRNADAITLAPLLRAAMANFSDASSTLVEGDVGAASSASSESTGGLSTAAREQDSSGSLSSGSVFSKTTPVTSTGGQIQADAATNSLIISAPPPVYRQLRSVIDQLDERRAQVYVEALIAEVSSEAGSDLGVQWLLAGSGRSGGVIGVSNSGDSDSIVNLAAGIYEQDAASIASSIAEGFTLGLYKGSVAVLANALESHADANILSTPTITTLDNQEAKILIGQNIPVATGSYSTTSSSSTVTPFTTYDRLDVGLTLDIRPQINADGTVKMQIYQEVSSLAGSLASLNASNIITNKRTINTTVLVQDGDTIVLGGLMQDEINRSNWKVPLLSRIPLLGSLFRSSSDTKSKTNLMIFLRPVVMRSADRANALTLDRYDRIRAIQQLAEEGPGVDPIVLPAISAVPAASPEGATAAPVVVTPEMSAPLLVHAATDIPSAGGSTGSGSAARAGWVVQVAAMSRLDKANELQEKLRATGYDSYVDSVNIDGKALWRVRVNAQQQREQAQRLRERIKTELGIAGNVVNVF